MTKAFRAALMAAAVLFSSLLPILPAMAQGSCPFDIGTLAGGASSVANALNDNGQVVGISQTSDGKLRAFSWRQETGIQELATLPSGRNSTAGSVNASGQIAGSFEDGQGVSHAVLWPQAGATPQDLGTLPGVAGPINDIGQVVINSVDHLHAFLWTIGNTPPGTPLRTLPGSSGFIQPKALNAQGQVIGQTDTAPSRVYPAGLRHGFSWTGAGGIVDLLSIGGARVLGQFAHSEAVAVNAGGQIVGQSNTDVPGTAHASSWTAAGGVPMDLHTLSSTSDSTTSSVANAVNDSGQVVGSSDTGDFVNGQPVSHAFLWTYADGMRDLGTLGGIGSSATAINASGWIVGNSYTGDIVNGAPVSHAFLWTQTHGMLDLGTLPSGTNSRAMAVNANGDIIGQSDLPATPAGVQQMHAVLWPSRCWEPNTFQILGQVTALKGGSPIPGAAVRVIQIDAGVPGIITSVTDSAGFYSIRFYRGSYDGRYSVTAFTSGFEDMSIVIDKIDSGAVITKDFALGRIGVLKGMVTDTNALPLAGAGVLVGEGVPVVGQPNTFKFSTHTNSAGKYSIMIEPHGAYKALAFQPGFNDSPPADITINTDDETPQDFALSKAMTGNITGIVQDADSGDLLENATVVATGVDPPSQSIMTDTSAGAYTLSNVPAGRYQVAAGARGYAEDNEIVKVIAGQTVTASFELVRKRRR